MAWEWGLGVRGGGKAGWPGNRLGVRGGGKAGWPGNRLGVRGGA